MAEDLYQNKDDSNDRSSPNGNQSDLKDDDICRYYLRNVCRRGGSCKYRHPDEGDISNLDKMVDFVFCHDYQNRECRRQNCRFVHATKLEEEGFRVTGKLPPHVLERINVMKGYGELVGTIVGGGPPDAIPICKDYLKGECRRGQGRCKFRHLTQREADVELGLLPPPGHGGHHGYGGHGHGHGDPYGRYQSSLHQPPAHHVYGHPSTQPMTNGHHHGPYSHQPPPPPPPLPHHMSRAGMSSNHYPQVPPGGSSVPPYPPARGYGRRDLYCDPVYAPPEKKSRGSFDPFGDPNDANANPPGGANSSSSAQSQPGGVTSRLPPLGGVPSASNYALEEENSALRRRVEELKKQVADLMATNEFLLEQNAQLRACAKNSSSVSGNLPGTVTALAAVASAGPPGQVVTPVGVTTATVELPVVSIGGLSAVTGLPVSSIAASLNSAIISTSSASVTSGVNSALVTYPHIVATSAALNHHNSLAR